VLNGLNAPTGGHVIAFEVIKVAQSIEHFSILLFDDPAINEIQEIAQGYGRRAVKIGWRKQHGIMRRRETVPKLFIVNYLECFAATAGAFRARQGGP